MSKIIKSAPLNNDDQFLSLRPLAVTEPVLEEEKTASPEELILLAQQQAEELINRARQEAEQIVQQTREQAQREALQIKELAHKSGWQEGVAASEAEANTIREQASEVLKQAREVYNRTLETMETEIVDLAVDIAERVVMAQLAVEPGTVMEIARECMELVKNKPLVNIYVSNADFNIVKEEENQLLQGLPGKVNLNILVDNGVQPGGCRIETDQGLVDATLETRWQELLKALYGQEE